MKTSAILFRLRQRAEAYDHRQANAAKRAATCAKAQRYDEPVEDDNGKPMESPLLSDRGRGAELIRNAGEVPRWKRTLAAILATYGDADLERIEAIADADNLADAARSLGVSRMTLYRLKDKLAVQLWPVLQQKREER